MKCHVVLELILPTMNKILDYYPEDNVNQEIYPTDE